MKEAIYWPSSCPFFKYYYFEKIKDLEFFLIYTTFAKWIIFEVNSPIFVRDQENNILLPRKWYSENGSSVTDVYPFYIICAKYDII